MSKVACEVCETAVAEALAEYRWFLVQQAGHSAWICTSECMNGLLRKIQATNP